VVIIGNGFAGLWALGAQWKPALRTRALWWFTVFVEFAIFVQVALGVGMVAGQHREAPQFHMFYGFVAIIAVGIAYSYRQSEWVRLHVYGFYGGVGLFLMGLGIRAMLVAAR
jgi:predicted transporter